MSEPIFAKPFFHHFLHVDYQMEWRYRIYHVVKVLLCESSDKKYFDNLI